MPNRSCVLSFAAALVSTCLLSQPAHADVILLGTDYLQTISPTNFGGLGDLKGLAIGPGNTDTVVRRTTDCTITLSLLGSICTIQTEMIALSLQSTINPLLLVRESPTLQSRGRLNLTSNGSGSGGTFTSFFDVFFEISVNGGANWTPQATSLTLTNCSNSPLPSWSTAPTGSTLLVPGPVGDPLANLHTNKGAGQADFYISSVCEEEPGLGVHSAIPTQVTPEPGTAVLLLPGLGLLGVIRRRLDGKKKRALHRDVC